MLLHHGWRRSSDGGASGGQSPGATKTRADSTTAAGRRATAARRRNSKHKKRRRLSPAGRCSGISGDCPAERSRTALQAEAAQLQRQADALKKQKHQAQDARRRRLNKLQKKADKGAHHRAGGDKRATDPRIVHLQKDLLATSGVVALTPPQVSDTGDALVPECDSDHPLRRPTLRLPWSRRSREVKSPTTLG